MGALSDALHKSQVALQNQLSGVQQSIQSDPQLQDMVKRAQSGLSFPDLMKLKSQIDSRLSELGTPMPDNWGISRSGAVEEGSSFPWLKAILTLAAPVLIGAAAGAGGFGGGAASASTGAASATTPIAEGAAAGTLPSTTIGTGMIAAAPASIPSGALATGGTLSSIGQFLSKGGKISDILKAAGGATGAATEAATQRRLASEPAFDARSNLEEKQRNQAISDIYRSNAVLNPVYSPYDPRASELRSQVGQPAVANSMRNLQQMQIQRLPNLHQYGVETLPDVKSSGLETVGNWLSPILTGIGVGADVLSGSKGSSDSPTSSTGGTSTLDQIRKLLAKNGGLDTSGMIWN